VFRLSSTHVTPGLIAGSTSAACRLLASINSILRKYPVDGKSARLHSSRYGCMRRGPSSVSLCATSIHERRFMDRRNLRGIMDKALEQITDFAASVRPRDVPGKVIEHVTGILADTIACAMAARDCPGAVAAAAIADLPRAAGGTVIGSSAVVTLDMAAFWNTSMIRYLD